MLKKAPMKFDKELFKGTVLNNIKTLYRRTLEEATEQQIFQAVSYAIKDVVVDNWMATQKEYEKKDPKIVYYMSMEFLMGRALGNNLINLRAYKEVAEALDELGVDLNLVEDQEPDPALGNGGLGRLAACFLDSLATLNYAAYGCGIRYRYGMFRQEIRDGYQVEVPDNWLADGYPFELRRPEYAKEVKFGGWVSSYVDENGRTIFKQEGYQSVQAVPYDMPIIGKRVNVLRLYQAEGNENAEKISGVLYPPDDTEEGKLLRIRQEYFLSAAAVGDIIREYEKRHGNDYRQFALENSIQLNDTHPVFAIPELIRVLQEKGLTYRAALKTAKQVFNYTNHTILPEALEHWDVRLLKKILPEITEILLSINTSARYRHRKEGYTSQESAATSIYVHSRRAISMANTAVFVANKINGVAEIHSEIIKRDLFAAEYSHHPEKFTNVTNGVAQRRWLQLANPELSSLLDRKIGQDWRERFEELGNLNEHADTETLSDFIRVKEEKKAQLFRYIEQTEGVKIGGNRILFAQVKRLHEYKRQLMTAFALLRLYYDLKNGKIKDFTPSVFLFGAKSAPSYFRAKGIIKYINEIIKLINADPETNSLLMGVFVTEYNVSYAEKIVAATDVSLQVSTAGLEASGTGNMKFMMNGAVTLGTMDGANIEIVEKAGEENNYIFGARVDEIEKLREGGYNPNTYLKKHADWKKAVHTLTDGTFSDDGKGYFDELYRSLTVGASWHKPDHYFIFRDLEEYYQTILQVNHDYKNRIGFANKQFKNTANSFYFSSDRSIREYAKKIWSLSY